jgi:hypothetical protein
MFFKDDRVKTVQDTCWSGVDASRVAMNIPAMPNIIYCQIKISNYIIMSIMPGNIV